MSEPISLDGKAEDETLTKKEVLKSSIIDPKQQKAIWRNDYEKFRDFVGKSQREVKKDFRGHKPEEKIFIFSCLHIPFDRQDLFVRSVEEAVADGCTTAVAAGDFIDCYGMCGAKFNKVKRFEFPLREEVKRADLYLQYLSEKFEKVYFLGGNHLERVRKFFAERVGPENLWLVRYDLLEFMTEPYGNFEVVRNSFRGNDVNWLWRHGDLVVTHREIGSGIPLRPTLATHDRLQNWQHVFGFNDDYRCLVEAHTHLLGQVTFLDGKYLLFEAGCLCKHPQYAMEAKFPYPFPQTCGYTVIATDRGRVDFQNSYQRFFEYNIKYKEKL